MRNQIKLSTQSKMDKQQNDQEGYNFRSKEKPCASECDTKQVKIKTITYHTYHRRKPSFVQSTRAFFNKNCSKSMKYPSVLGRGFICLQREAEALQINKIVRKND